MHSGAIIVSQVVAIPVVASNIRLLLDKIPSWVVLDVAIMSIDSLWVV